MRGVVVPGAAPPPFSAGMGASGFFRTALRRTGMRAVRLRSASSGTKVSVKRARIGRAGPPLLLLPDAGAVVRIHGPLPATLRILLSAMPFTNILQQIPGPSSRRTDIISSTTWAIGCLRRWRLLSARNHGLPGCWPCGPFLGWNWRCWRQPSAGESGRRPAGR